MLVRVSDALDATKAAAASADAVELVVAGVSSADLEVARAVRIAFAGTLRLRFEGLTLSPEIVGAATAVRADEVALALDLTAPPVPLVDAGLPPDLGSVALVSATADRVEAIQRVRGRVDAVMLEAAAPTRLVDAMTIAELDAFASACRAAGLSFGLAGALEAPDVARLLLLEPDTLGFDAAVRLAHRADSGFDARALAAIRALIPRDGMTAAGPLGSVATDRIFVRDFVTLLSIGAYQAELGVKQRVRFSIAADVRREPTPPHDMRDVFSYDIILETIRVLSQRDHVTFVETLAEEIAASLLAHAALVAVKVKVEKLDVIEGAVGIEINRRRPS